MLSRAFVVLFIAMFVAMLGVGMVSPLLPVYVREDLGGPAIAVALSFSGLAIAQIIMSPWTGRWGDRYGLKRFIVGGFVIYAIGAFGYLFSPNWELVVFFRILSGVGAAGVFPMTLAYVGRLAPPQGEGRYMGVFMMAQMTGFGLGPLVGGGLRDVFNSETAFATMGILLAATALGALLLLPSQSGGDGEGDELPWLAVVQRKSVQAAVLFMVMMAFGWGAAFAFLAIFVVDEAGLGLDSTLFVGLLLSGRQVTNALLQPLTGALADRYARTRLIAIGLSVSATSQLLIPLVPGTLVDVPFGAAVFTIAPAVLAVVLLAGIGEAIAMPAQQAIFVSLGRLVGMGSLMGLNNMGISIGLLAGSLAGAVVVEVFGINAVFLFSGAVLYAGTVVYLLAMRRARDEMREAEEQARRIEEGREVEHPAPRPAS